MDLPQQIPETTPAEERIFRQCVSSRSHALTQPRSSWDIKEKPSKEFPKRDDGDSGLAPALLWIGIQHYTSSK